MYKITPIYKPSMVPTCLPALLQQFLKQVGFLPSIQQWPNGSDMGSVFAEVAGSSKDLKGESKENNGGELHLAGGSFGIID
ncbi:uncharacterized protein ARB_05910 [Trichophyton benhamiae CBS 112371]|uniref:Uncharacterized protein n=1 Tax=Arthroderma benhamiae (strain ATCC MYA-4681 / CBS 112371) TaxID=663331 RepID=D4ANU3_ARTBC|nr:uncharacterized protein ARB_05910 [Trichophyton benhamiae CBS 112371]EFE34954.1 hypothetical protein ARB_05910 [Trichophyton benhamiae CBS 112371]